MGATKKHTSVVGAESTMVAGSVMVTQLVGELHPDSH
jgi:hypothetical protein